MNRGAEDLVPGNLLPASVEKNVLTHQVVCTIIFKSDIVKKCNSIAPEEH